MSAFERLHPAVQHHVVNSLGWKSLRPLQDAAIEPVLHGENALLLAPTAGGKTEAAVLPILSKMLQADWQGLSVLYLCPIKALLNNLETRLHYYSGLVGRRASVWHGDVSTSARNQILREPPDVLLTTPESLEVMLTSNRIDSRALLGQMRCVIIDELHAFAGDDRGWHLLALLERVSRIAGHDLQRLGLSATVGNPAELLAWLEGSSDSPGRVITSPVVPPGEDVRPDVTLDYVGNLENAATVISRLHRGEKRLVFCDSRARVEQLSHILRALEVPTFVSHSSLSVDERRQAEAAFANRRDAVIVATSTLELGIDVGDLDRVIQIDAPGTVASFLQRLGRTGRRQGSERNCLFLATRESGFLQSAGLLKLWSTGFVEPVIPPVYPFHILAQQLMALVLQEGGIGRTTWLEWLVGLVDRLDSPEIPTMLMDYMLQNHLLHDDSGIVSFGVTGERAYGWRNFMELMSVFTSDPMIAVRHGREELGFVHPLTFAGPAERSPVLMLAGRGWVVRHVDWARKVAHVAPSELRGRSQWLGGSSGLSGELCRSVRSVLDGEEPSVRLTNRAAETLDEVREAHAWVCDGHTSLVREVDGTQRWWTFAGMRANASLRLALGPLSDSASRDEDFAIGLTSETSIKELEQQLKGVDAGELAARLPVDDDTMAGLKFSDCLPPSLATREIRARLSDETSVSTCLTENVTNAVNAQ